MDVELITMDREVALQKLRDYKKVLAKRAHQKAQAHVMTEYEKIKDGYEAAAKGLSLLSLTAAMRRGGFDKRGRPRFAVARADQHRIRCSVEPWRTRFWSQTLQTRSHLREFSFSSQELPTPQNMTNNWLSAIVPIVPADVLPARGCDLSKRVILWEADWQEAPADPLLLLPLGGDLYAVEAAWDLTDLERAIIAGTRR